MTVAEAVAAATRRLTNAGVPDAGRDARRLVAFALGVEADRLTVLSQEQFEAAAALDAAVGRREARVPVSQIVGWREFWGRRFRVTPDVLDPRPETETLIEAALSQPFGSVLDLGVGSGCILLTLMAERPGVEGAGTDIAEAALEVAGTNADALGLSPRLMVSDWCEGLAGEWDLIVSNPPYVTEAEMSELAPDLAHEPRQALTPGGDGLEAYRRIASGVEPHLAPGGRILLEIGAAQAEAVGGLLTQAGLVEISVVQDLDGRDRVVSAYRRHR